MREMLHDAAGDIDTLTGGVLRFYIDTLGLSGGGGKVRHNCYLRVVKTDSSHLLFRVTTPLPGPWPASATTPAGESFEDIPDEPKLRDVIQTILQRERTKEVVLFLLSAAH
jgi:hypothetical protein